MRPRVLSKNLLFSLPVFIDDCSIAAFFQKHNKSRSNLTYYSKASKLHCKRIPNQKRRYLRWHKQAQLLTGILKLPEQTMRKSKGSVIRRFAFYRSDSWLHL